MRGRPLRVALGIVFVVGAVAIDLRASAAEPGRIEVIEVSGIIDGSVERAVIGGIEAAEREDAALVVLQIDSAGVVEAARTERMLDRIRRADVPVATWVGPPRASAEQGAALLALSGHVRAVAPGTSLGPVVTLDLRRKSWGSRDPLIMSLLGSLPGASSRAPAPFGRRLGAEELEDAGLIDHVIPAVADLLDEIDGTRVNVRDESVPLSTNSEESTVRFHSLDLFGRALHAAAQPSISYLLLLLGLVGLVFEIFHPSTGPAGVAGAAALALSLYGVVVLGGSWLGVALIVAGVAGFAVDLRYQSLGPFTAAGFVGLTAGSLLLFPGPWLRVSPWVLAFGIVGMVAFLLGAMTRVLRDLRAVARGELEVRDAHPHPNGQGGDHAS